MRFELQILGTGSALPAYGRHLSAQVLFHHNELFLFDCGEGTQFQLHAYAIKLMRIRCIFISHLHGDHVFGLAGLLQSFNHLNRTEELHVFGPPGIQKLIDAQLAATGNPLVYPLEVEEQKPSELTPIWQNNHITVSCFPLIHRIPTLPG